MNIIDNSLGHSSSSAFLTSLDLRQIVSATSDVR